MKPSTGRITGMTVTVSGAFLGDGTDVTQIKVCGNAFAAPFVSQSRTDVVLVLTTLPASAQTCNVEVTSTVLGVLTKSNGFEVLPRTSRFPHGTGWRR